MEPIRTATVEAARLTDTLDTLADVAAAIERHADGHGPRTNPDRLIATLRGIIAEFAFDLDAGAHLSRSRRPVKRAPAAAPRRSCHSFSISSDDAEHLQPAASRGLHQTGRGQW